MDIEFAPRRAVPPDLLNERQTSDWLGIPATTLQVWRCTGRVALPYVKLGGHVRYRRSAIEAFIAQNTHGAEV